MAEDTDAFYEPCPQCTEGTVHYTCNLCLGTKRVMTPLGQRLAEFIEDTFEVPLPDGSTADLVRRR